MLPNERHRSSRAKARGSFLFGIPLVHPRRQMLDAALERAVVALTDDHVYVPLVVVDQRLAQRCEVAG